MTLRPIILKKPDTEEFLSNSIYEVLEQAKLSYGRKVSGWEVSGCLWGVEGLERLKRFFWSNGVLGLVLSDGCIVLPNPARSNWTLRAYVFYRMQSISSIRRRKVQVLEPDKGIHPISASQCRLLGEIIKCLWTWKQWTITKHLHRVVVWTEFNNGSTWFSKDPVNVG